MLDRGHPRLQGMVESDPESARFLTDNLRRNGEVWQLDVDGLPESARRNAEDARAGDGEVSELHELRAIGCLDRNQFARRESLGGPFPRTLDADEAKHDEDNQIVPGPGQCGT